jgi:hypothetical protein
MTLKTSFGRDSESPSFDKPAMIDRPREALIIFETVPI